MRRWPHAMAGRGLYLLFLLAVGTPALARPPEQLDRRMERLRTSFGVPGVSVAIVEKGKTTYARGFGSRDLEGRKPVDADTIFPIGSTAKAMTAAALATLVDRGEIKWDDRVIDHLPDFRMYDPWVTREITIRDLLTHRTGLGPDAGILLFAPQSNLSRSETVRRLRYIKPATSFRSTYSYDNLAYIVLGELIEKVSGKSWERYVTDYVLEPSGMDDATVDTLERLETANRAYPHARIQGAFRGDGPQVQLDDAKGFGDNVGPAGGIAASAADMAAWLKVQLGRGQGAGRARVYSESQATEMWKPVSVMPIGTPPPELSALKPNFLTYALGWSVRDYRGERVIMHTGAILGSLATVVLLPDRDVGFYIAINSEDNALIRGMTYELLDHYLDAPVSGWPEKLRAQTQAELKEALPIAQAAASAPAVSDPSLPLSAYAGTYVDPWFGAIEITERNGKLTIGWPHSPGLVAELDHWQHDSFKARYSDLSVDPIFVSFELDPAGSIRSVRMRPASPFGGYDYEDLLFEPVTKAN